MLKKEVRSLASDETKRAHKMDNPGLSAALWSVLDGRLWHATGPSELEGIIANGEVRVLGSRYSNALCKAYDAVSLMDFGPSATGVSNQFYNWVGWMGNQQHSRVAVWLEIDRECASANLIDAGAALDLWREQNFSRQIIPGVEACHRGGVPVTAILSVLLIDQYYDHARFLQCAMAADIIASSLADFERSLTAPPEGGIGHALDVALAGAKDRK